MPPEAKALTRPWPLAGANCLLDTPDARLRLAAAASMASTLVHEVNEPLTAAASSLSACARRLRARGEGNEDVLAMLDHAAGETLKAGEIIRRTRNFVVNGRISGVRENLRTIVERAILMLGDSRDAVGLTTEVSLDLFVRVDRLQIEQLLGNLLAHVCAALAGKEDGWIELQARRAGSEILLAVADNGPGLGADALAELAEPRAWDGAGLGLAVASVIAEAHGGRLVAANPSHGGVRFELALPAA